MISHDTDEWCKVWRKIGSWLQKWHDEFGKFNRSSGKSENLHFDVLLFSITYKVSAKKMQKSYLSWHWRVIQTLKKKFRFCLKNGMNNLVNFNSSSGKSENFYFDEVFLSKLCNVWAKKIETNCVMKNDLWFQKRHKEISEILQ